MRDRKIDDYCSAAPRSGMVPRHRGDAASRRATLLLRAGSSTPTGPENCTCLWLGTGRLQRSVGVLSYDLFVFLGAGGGGASVDTGALHGLFPHVAAGGAVDC